jgi:hypothetical protein
MLLQSQPDSTVQDQVHEASHEDGGLDVQMQSTQNNTLLLMIAADRSECADCLSIDFLPQPMTGKHGWMAQAQRVSDIPTHSVPHDPQRRVQPFEDFIERATDQTLADLKQTPGCR